MPAWKKFLSLALSGMLILSISTTALAADNGFPMFFPWPWYAEAEFFMQENNLLDPAGGDFDPNAEANLSALLTALHQSFGDSAQTASDWAEEQGLLENLNTSGQLSREDLVTILWRCEGCPEEDAEDFEDQAEIASYAVKAVKWSRAKGIVVGRPDSLFAPHDNATQAELAVVLYRFITLPRADESSLVEISTGLLEGTQEDGIYRYLGIPYAQATERFVPAGPAEPWEGVRFAGNYGPASPQGAILGMPASGEEDGTDNNCQNLNLWTPGLNDGAKRPVMVWLHGGGFSTGSGNEANYDGANLSRSGDVVVVAVNHRLNLFGHLDLSAYGEKYESSGNVGVMDLIAALEWIQENIEVFGGDPNNVTIFGQSGGGAKVLALMTSPYAKGLFHKGIVQSGATETMGVTFSSAEISARLTEHMLENLDITADNIEDLQTLPASALQAASAAALQTTAEEFKIPAALGGGYSMEWGPVVDGDFLPSNPVTGDSFAEAGEDIPLLIGSNLNEWSFMPSQEEQEVSPELRAAIQEAYPDKENLQVSQIDTLIRLPMLKIMAHKADQGGAPVYAYLFDFDNAFHGAEIPLVFRNTDQPLAELVSQAWVSFARTGTPEMDGLADWEPYTRESGATLLLDTVPELVHHHDQALLELLAPDYKY